MVIQNYIENEKSTSLITYCLAWCVQRMRPILEGVLKDDIAQAIQATCDKKSWKVLELNFSPDHLVVRVQATAGDSAEDVVKILKNASAAGLRQKHASLRKLPGLWKSKSFFASTEGGELPMEQILKYCDMQKARKV